MHVPPTSSRGVKVKISKIRDTSGKRRRENTRQTSDLDYARSPGQLRCMTTGSYSFRETSPQGYMTEGDNRGKHMRMACLDVRIAHAITKFAKSHRELREIEQGLRDPARKSRGAVDRITSGIGIPLLQKEVWLVARGDADTLVILRYPSLRAVDIRMISFHRFISRIGYVAKRYFLPLD